MNIDAWLIENNLTQYKTQIQELLQTHEKIIKKQCADSLSDVKVTGEAFDKLLDVFKAHVISNGVRK